MKTEKSVIELLESANSSYVSKSEEQLIAAYAERSDYLSDLILSAVKSLGSIFSGFKVSRMSVSQAA